MSDSTIIDARGQATRVVETVNRAAATLTRTTTVPGRTTTAVEVTGTSGRLTSRSSSSVGAATTFQYDGLGRL